MKKITYKFPDKESFEKFMRYIIHTGCIYNPNTLMMTCDFDSLGKRIAVEIFNAEVVE